VPAHFAGGKDQVFLDNDKRDTGTSYGYYVKCSCGAEGAVGAGKAEAAALWNKRSETPIKREPLWGTEVLPNSTSRNLSSDDWLSMITVLAVAEEDANG